MGFQQSAKQAFAVVLPPLLWLALASPAVAQSPLRHAPASPDASAPPLTLTLPAEPYGPVDSGLASWETLVASGDG